jgi:hypothetical protein
VVGDLIKRPLGLSNDSDSDRCIKLVDELVIMCEASLTRHCKVNVTCCTVHQNVTPEYARIVRFEVAEGGGGHVTKRSRRS